MSAPRFSVVIPAYNAPRTIGRAIESALAQTVDDLEVVVVDDGSTDNTAAIARKHEPDPRVRVIRQANQGVAGAKNTGISASTGELIAFLDNDDLLMPRYLEEMRDALAADSRAGLAFADGWLLDERTGRLSRRSMSSRWMPDPMPRTREALIDALIQCNFIITAVTVRRKAVEDAGVFDPQANGADDLELWLRMLVGGWTAARAPGRLVVKGWRDDAQSRHRGRMAAAQIAALRLFCAQHGAPAASVRAAHARIDEIPREADEIAAGDEPSIAWRAAKRLAHPLRWHLRPPAEVRQAFPTLGAGPGVGGPSSSPPPS